MVCLSPIPFLLFSCGSGSCPLWTLQMSLPLPKSSHYQKQTFSSTRPRSSQVLSCFSFAFVFCFVFILVAKPGTSLVLFFFLFCSPILNLAYTTYYFTSTEMVPCLTAEMSPSPSGSNLNHLIKIHQTSAISIGLTELLQLPSAARCYTNKDTPRCLCGNGVSCHHWVHRDRTSNV